MRKSDICGCHECKYDDLMFEFRKLIEILKKRNIWEEIKKELDEKINETR